MRGELLRNLKGQLSIETVFVKQNEPQLEETCQFRSYGIRLWNGTGVED